MFWEELLDDLNKTSGKIQCLFPRMQSWLRSHHCGALSGAVLRTDADWEDNAVEPVNSLCLENVIYEIINALLFQSVESGFPSSSQPEAL